MKSIVVHVSDDVCAKNGRDPEATKLIEIARTFGSVETLESALAADRAKSQVVINNLTEQLEAIKENEVTPAELELLRAIRKKAAKEAEQYQADIKQRDDQLKAIQVENENRAAAIRTMFGL